MLPTPEARARVLRRLSLLLLACPGALVACAPDPGARSEGPAGPGAGADAQARAPREVRTARVAEHGFERALHATGELVAFEETTLAAKVPGRLERLLVDLGSRVRRGELLAQIEPRDYELRVTRAEAALAGARALLGLGPDEPSDAVDPESTADVRAARAELADAQRERDRLVELSGRGVSTQASLDTAQARVQRAESQVQGALEGVASALALVAQRRAELATARQDLADTRVLAPFDGAVAERLAGTGSYLATGDALLRLVQDDPLRLRLRVGERDAAAVRLGQELRVSVEGVARDLSGRIVRLAPAIGARDRTLRVEAEIPNPEGAWRAGSFAQARIVIDPSEKRVAVPEPAIVSFAGIDRVLVVEQGLAKELRVELGRRDGGLVEVLDGLEGGEEVVLSPGSLQGGAPVVVAP